MGRFFWPVDKALVFHVSTIRAIFVSDDQLIFFLPYFQHCFDGSLKYSFKMIQLICHWNISTSISHCFYDVSIFFNVDKFHIFVQVGLVWFFMGRFLWPVNNALVFLVSTIRAVFVSDDQLILFLLYFQRCFDGSLKYSFDFVCRVDLCFVVEQKFVRALINHFLTLSSPISLSKSSCTQLV